jgi:hypothetical protein
MPHALAANLGFRNLHAAAVADFAFIAYFLIFTAVTFPILGGPENPFTEKAIPFGLKSAVVDGLGLFNFAVRP